MVMDSVSSKQTDKLLSGCSYNGLSQAKNEITEGNCIFSACDSVYRDIFVSRRQTVSLTVKS